MRFSCLWQAIKKASIFRVARANHSSLATVKGGGYRQSIDTSCGGKVDNGYLDMDD